MNEWFTKKAKRLLCGLIAFVILAGYLPGLSVLAHAEELFETDAAQLSDGSGPNAAGGNEGAGDMGEEEASLAGPGRLPRITIQNPGDEEVVDFGEEEIPLAGPASHHCCVLHFMLLLAALAVETLYISRIKKGQKDIFAAREKLQEYNGF